MNDETNNTLMHDADEILTRRDVLIARVVDGEADDAQWQEFCALAADDEGAWRDLAEAQREHALLCGAIGRQLTIDKHVDLPIPGAPPTMRLLVRSWAGWAVAAAAMMLAWGWPLIGGGGSTSPVPAVRVAAADPGLMRINSPEDAVAAYLAKGKAYGTVLGEMPERLVVDTRPCETGDCYEVLYLRQFIERAEVCDIKKFGTNDAGQAVPVPVADPGPPGQPM